MVSHLTQIHAVEMRGGLSPQLLLPSRCSQACLCQTHRLSGSFFHCEGKVRVHTPLCLDNTQSADKETRSCRGFPLIGVAATTHGQKYVDTQTFQYTYVIIGHKYAAIIASILLGGLYTWLWSLLQGYFSHSAMSEVGPWCSPLKSVPQSVFQVITKVFFGVEDHT